MRARVVLIAGALAGCIGDVDLPPPAPGLLPFETPTRRPVQTLAGTKTKGTAILNFDQQVVPADDSENWSFDLALSPGENSVELRAQKPSGLISTRAARATIVFEPAFPASPTVAPYPSPTATTPLAIGGQKPRGSSLEIDGREIHPLDDAEDWSAQLDLVEGNNLFRLVAKDAAGRSSEPVDLLVILDRAPPVLRSRAPSPGEAGVPTDAVISLGFDGPLAIEPSAVDAAILRVEVGGAPLPGALGYSPLAASLVFTPSSPLPPQTAVEVRVDPGRIRDLAGNAAAGGLDFNFTTGDGPDPAVPAGPSLSRPLPAPTTATSIALAGGKPPLTAIWLGGQEIVAIDPAAGFRYDLPLAVGDNAILLRTRSRSGVLSQDTITATVTRELARPGAPRLDPAPPAAVTQPSLVLEGTRDPDTSIVLNGLVVVPRGQDPRWVYSAELVPGPNELELRARNADGVQSDPVLLSVDFAQPYQGPVPPGFQLTFAFTLRDLASVHPIRTSFETGPNNYALDIWVEGPLDPGESCDFDPARQERRRIKYLATIEHYRGIKANHENAFAEPDYAGTDFLAALIDGGVLASRGLVPGSARRSATGALLDNVAQALTIDAVDAIEATCSGATSINIDGCSNATTRAGPKVVQWIPLRPDSQRIAQGDYLLHVLINLDRDPTWVASNDRESCWGLAEHTRRGAHRIVRRLGLGATPYTVRFGASIEGGGPDAESGAEQLLYLTGDGLRVSWGPAR